MMVNGCRMMFRSVVGRDMVVRGLRVKVLVVVGISE